MRSQTGSLGCAWNLITASEEKCDALKPEMLHIEVLFLWHFQAIQTCHCKNLPWIQVAFPCISSKNMLPIPAAVDIMSWTPCKFSSLCRKGGFAVTSKAWSAVVEFPPCHWKDPTTGLRLHYPVFPLMCQRSLRCPYWQWNTGVLLTCCVVSHQGSLHQTLNAHWSDLFINALDQNSLCLLLIEL